MKHQRIRSVAIAAVGLSVLAGVGLSELGQPDPAESTARFEVDHIFFFCKPFAPEMSALEAAGFRRMPHTNPHGDQGTIGRYFYMDNVYVEFLWVTDDQIATANEKRCDTDMNARQNWRDTEGVSPIGIGIRDHEYAEDPPAKEHVYKADWMGSGEDYLGVFTPEYRLNEPWVFRMPPHWTVPAVEEMTGDGAEFLAHPNGARVLTDVVFTVVGETRLSRGLRELSDDGKFSFISGEEPLVEMTFDDGAQGETADFRPETPLVIHY
ncbi:MAG: hypothetical protein ACI89L_002385 [Phycisphaerales bacterium]|jgi:hypothetical protein